MNPIDEYIKKFPKDTQAVLEKIRQTIRKAAPKAVETVSYGIPTFDLYGKHLIHFAGFKNHTSLFPTTSPIVVFKKELSGFKTSRGTIQFPLDEPVPYALIRRITLFRIKELTAKVKKTFKICSRGHTYKGSGPCPVCWPGALKKVRNVKRKSNL